MKHGHTARGYKSPTYNSWANMIDRCTNSHATKYPQYGARGIRVCLRWRSFAAFLADMGERPAGTTLDRKDNAKGYSKRNCRWASRSEQQSNKRKKVGRDVVMGMVKNGQTQSEVARRLGVSRSHVSNLVHGRYVWCGRQSQAAA